MTYLSDLHFDRQQADSAVVLTLAEVKREVETDINKRIELTKNAETRLALQGVLAVFIGAIKKRERI